MKYRYPLYFPCPDGCDPLAAGGHMSVYLTAWLALKERAAVERGQRVLNGTLQIGSHRELR